MNFKGSTIVTITILSLICFLYVSNSALFGRGLQNDITVVACQVAVFSLLLLAMLSLNYLFFAIRKRTISVDVEVKRSWPCAGIRIDGKRRMPCFNNAPFPYLVKPGIHTVEVRYKGETMMIEVGDAWKSTVSYRQDCDSLSCTINDEKYDETKALIMENQKYYAALAVIILSVILCIGGFCYITAMATW